MFAINRMSCRRWLLAALVGCLLTVSAVNAQDSSNGLEGFLHISELADHKVEDPEEVVKVGEEIQVKILRVDSDERKIGLSRKRVEWAEEAEAEQADGTPGKAGPGAPAV